MVPDDSLSIQQRAIAAWPPAWHGQNLRDIVTTLGYDIDRPWRELPKKDRDWLLFTDEQPTVPVYAGYDAAEVRRALKKKEEPSYMGTFTGARRYVLHTFATTQSALMKKRVSRYLISTDCPECGGKRLRREALSVTFAGRDIAEMSALPLKELAAVFQPLRQRHCQGLVEASNEEHPEKALVTQRIAQDLEARLSVLLDLGLGYLALDRSTPTLSPGELQRLRLATQVRSNLFGVVYVLDEPSAGLHPADTEALLRALDKLKASGNSLFVVEHNLDVITHADWIVDVGPAAGQHGGQILYSGPPAGLARIDLSSTRRYLFAEQTAAPRTPRTPQGWLRLERHHAQQPAGSGRRLSALRADDGDRRVGLRQVEPREPSARRAGRRASRARERQPRKVDLDDLERSVPEPIGGRITSGMEHIRRLVRVDQKPIGRTPRSNLATYTGLFDHVRKLFAATTVGKEPPVRRRPILIQRRQRTVRELRR